MGVAPPSSTRVPHAMGEDLPHVEAVNVSGVYAVEESEESADDAGVLELETRRSVVRPAVGGSGVARGSSASKRWTDDTMLVDLMPDDILPASTVVGAAFDLGDECSKLWQVRVPRSSLGAADIASLVTECTYSA